MFAVDLSGPSGTRRRASGADGAVYAVSSSLRVDQTADDLAIYHGGFWHSVDSADTYDAVAIQQPCVVRFEEFDGANDEGLTLGPFDGVVIRAGIIRTSGPKPRLLARFDDSLEQWRAIDGQRLWPVVVISDARN